MAETSGPPAAEDPITEVPRRDNKRLVFLTVVVIIAIVLGLRRARAKPVASDAAPPETES